MITSIEGATITTTEQKKIDNCLYYDRWGTELHDQLYDMMSVILCDYNTAAFLLWRKYDCTRYWSKRKRTWTDRRLCQISNIKYLFAVTFLSFLIQSEHLRLLRKSEVLFRSRCTFDSNDLTWLPTSYSLYRDTMISRLIPLLVGLTGTRDWMLFRISHNFQIFTHRN